MRGYGLPRTKELWGTPHCGQARQYAVKPSRFNRLALGAEVRSNFKSAARKAAIRRVYKSRERRFSFSEEI